MQPTVLLVDEDPAIMATLGPFLSRAGFIIVRAGDGLGVGDTPRQPSVMGKAPQSLRTPIVDNGLVWGSPVEVSFQGVFVGASAATGISERCS